MNERGLNERLLAWALSEILLLERELRCITEDACRWMDASDAAEDRIEELEKWGNDVVDTVNAVRRPPKRPRST